MQMWTQQKALMTHAPLSRGVLLVTSLSCVALLASRVDSWLSKYPPSGTLIATVGLTTSALALAYLAIRGRGSVARRMALEIALFGAALLAVEAWIIVSTPDPRDRGEQRARTASRLGIPF